MAYARKLYEPDGKEPITISRSKLDIFVECQRCSYLDLRLGVRRVEMPSFTLNNAVDALLKREFDIHRAAQTSHPLMQAYKVEAKPFDDSRMEEWRDALKRGITYHHKPSNFILRGGIDDVWVNPKGELIIVDYKATSKATAPTGEDDLYDAYKRQLEIYQWLFRRNGFTVSPTVYFVYVNGKSDARAFDGKLEFDVNLIPYTGNDRWVEGALMNMKKVLSSDSIPPIGKGFRGAPCDYCTYREAAGKALQGMSGKAKMKSGKLTQSAKKQEFHGQSLFN
jgi:hypothetical protein